MEQSCKNNNIVFLSLFKWFYLNQKEAGFVQSVGKQLCKYSLLPIKGQFLVFDNSSNFCRCLWCLVIGQLFFKSVHYIAL